jgi:flavodoxin
MKALIVYDSFFGNTEQIAQAVGRALGPPEEVQVVRVSNVQPGQLSGLNLLIVGSPTRAFRPSPLTTKWLGVIPANALQGVKVAAFDTRIPWDRMPGFLRAIARVFGFAAKPISDKLQRKGGTVAAPPEGFFVNASEGPLAEGELERAVAWAKQLAGA